MDHQKQQTSNASILPSTFNKLQWGQLPLVRRRNCQPSIFVGHTQRPRTRPNFKTNVTCPHPFRTELLDKGSQIVFKFFPINFLQRLRWLAKQCSRKEGRHRASLHGVRNCSQSQTYLPSMSRWEAKRRRGVTVTVLSVLTNVPQINMREIARRWDNGKQSVLQNGHQCPVNEGLSTPTTYIYMALVGQVSWHESITTGRENNTCKTQ